MNLVITKGQQHVLNNRKSRESQWERRPCRTVVNSSALTFPEHALQNKQLNSTTSVPGHNTNHNKLNRIKIIQDVFSDHRKICWKSMTESL